jgi:hypothetical protein
LLALPSALALAPTAESSPAPENFFAKTPFRQRLPLYGQNHFGIGFWSRDQNRF